MCIKFGLEVLKNNSDFEGTNTWLIIQELMLTGVDFLSCSEAGRAL